MLAGSSFIRCLLVFPLLLNAAIIFSLFFFHVDSVLFWDIDFFQDIFAGNPSVNFHKFCIFHVHCMFVVASLIPCNAGYFFKITATATLLCTYEFLEQLFNHNFTPQITLPTRITEKTATLTDNIFVNDQTQMYNSGNIATSISDHLPQFIITENGKGD